MVQECFLDDSPNVIGRAVIIIIACRKWQVGHCISTLGIAPSWHPLEPHFENSWGFFIEVPFSSLNSEPSNPREAECLHCPGAGSAEAAFVMMESQLGSNSPGKNTAATAGAFAVQQSCFPSHPSTAYESLNPKPNPSSQNPRLWIAPGKCRSQPVATKVHDRVHLGAMCQASPV